MLSDIDRKMKTTLYFSEYSGSSTHWAALTESKEVDAILLDHSFYEMFRESYELLNDDIGNHVIIIDNITVSIDEETPPKTPPAITNS